MFILIVNKIINKYSFTAGHCILSINKVYLIFPVLFFQLFDFDCKFRTSIFQELPQTDFSADLDIALSMSRYLVHFYKLPGSFAQKIVLTLSAVGTNFCSSTKATSLHLLLSMLFYSESHWKYLSCSSMYTKLYNNQFIILQNQ